MPRIYAKGDLQTLDNEWRAIDTSVIPENLRNIDSTKQGPVYFYQELAKVEFDSQLLFKNLSTFALRLLALPVSNADAERLFSKWSNIKTVRELSWSKMLLRSKRPVMNFGLPLKC